MMKISFPQFKKLELADKETVQHFTQRYLPYSDYNFTSLWVYNIKNDMVISQLHNNLVVQFRDYTTGEPFLSFLGDTNVSQTIETLLQSTQQLGLLPYLQLIPEHNLKKQNNLEQSFSIEPSRDHFDYIYQIEAIDRKSVV